MLWNHAHCWDNRIFQGEGFWDLWESSKGEVYQDVGGELEAMRAGVEPTSKQTAEGSVQWPEKPQCVLISQGKEGGKKAILSLWMNALVFIKWVLQEGLSTRWGKLLKSSEDFMLMSELSDVILTNILPLYFKFWLSFILATLRSSLEYIQLTQAS